MKNKENVERDPLMIIILIEIQGVRKNNELIRL